jgi:hypothetical protein
MDSDYNITSSDCIERKDSSQDMMMKAEMSRTLPPIDANAPSRTETATIALG